MLERGSRMMLVERAVKLFEADRQPDNLAPIAKREGLALLRRLAEASEIRGDLGDDDAIRQLRCRLELDRVRA